MVFINANKSGEIVTYLTTTLQISSTETCIYYECCDIVRCVMQLILNG
jgi:hypothetical protein